MNLGVGEHKSTHNRLQSLSICMKSIFNSISRPRVFHFCVGLYITHGFCYSFTELLGNGVFREKKIWIPVY